MSKGKIDLWPYLQQYLEDEYIDETGLSPYLEDSVDSYTLEYVKYVVANNKNITGNLTDAEIEQWYNQEILPDVCDKSAPEITDMVQRVINVYFVKEYKFFFNKNNKKNSVDYVLNVDKVIEEKTGGAPPVIFNNVQIFMLNYEIKKLLDKAITISNEKYDNVVYINSRMTVASALNIVKHLENSYPKYSFNYVMLDKENEFADIKQHVPGITVVKSLF